MLRVLRVLRCSVNLSGPEFFDSGGQSKSVSLVQTQSRQQIPDTCISKLLYQAFHGGLSLAASVLIVTSVMLFLPATVY